MRKFYALTSNCHFDDLSYIIGVLLGDACVYKSHRGMIHHITKKPSYTYTIELQAKDKSFVDNFAQRLDRILHRPGWRRWSSHKNSRGYWRMVARNKSFGIWWKNISTEDLYKYALKHPANFIEGFYDAEGNLTMRTDKKSINEIRIFTINIQTRDLVCDAIRSLGLNVRWRIFRPKGTEVPLPQGGIAISNHDLFAICPSPYRKFFEHIHSSISRKNPPI